MQQSAASIKRVAFYTLGCKLNFSETSTISRQFLDLGYVHVEFKEKADIYVINTCSVTENADKEFRYITRLALRSNPRAFIIATGCYAQLKTKELSLIEGVDLVLGAFEKFKITDYISDISKKNVAEAYSCKIEETDFFVDSYSIGDRTRSFLKIQDGCDYKCSYCTIPLARGVSRSATLEGVLKNAREIARTGIKEIVLTGVNIGDYGKGGIRDRKHKYSFLELIKALDTLKEIKRFRISSIEPNLLDDQIIEFVSSSKRFVPHFHIPLQSGSNYILRKMRRRYIRELYAEKINRIKYFMPQACIGSDLIVGFPGESDEHFMETFCFLSDLEVSYLHVFTYSERKNTEAFRMEGEVPKSIRYKRNRLLRNLSVKKQYQFYKNQIGSICKVLFEQKNKEGFLYGYTENYIKVKIPWNMVKPNSIQEVYLKKISPDGFMLADTIKPD